MTADPTHTKKLAARVLAVGGKRSAVFRLQIKVIRSHYALRLDGVYQVEY